MQWDVQFTAPKHVQHSAKRGRLGCVNSPGGQREPGRGFTQPSLPLSAEYCTYRVAQKGLIKVA